MASNSLGNILKFSSFGESHGSAIGGVLDGFPAGIEIDQNFVQQQIERRKPHSKKGGTERKEDDEVVWLSGLEDNKTTGAPIAFLIKNKNQRQADYDSLKNVYRPSHADYTWQKKYGVRDFKGGGRASARETVVRVVAGALALLMLKKYNIELVAGVSQIGTIIANKDIIDVSPDDIKQHDYGFIDDSRAEDIDRLISNLKATGDTTGGIVKCVIRNVPAGLGEPVYHKLQADLAFAMMSINSVKGFEYGEGFNAASMLGSEHNDEFEIRNNEIRTKTNHSGGIQGGISNGEAIYFSVAFKPLSSIRKSQQTVNPDMEPEKIAISGRHDVCVVPRALPIVESMAALVIADFLLWAKASSIS
ncbi:MAG: chorismate synthase [Bacteroidales bacterium]